MRIWITAFCLMALSACDRVAFAQVPAMPYSFLARPLNGEPTNGSPLAVFLLSNSNIIAPYLTVAQSTGPSSGTNGILLLVDQEAMLVQSTFNPNGAMVVRGVNGTRVMAHGAFAKVWIASRGYFWPRNPSGVCNPPALQVTPAMAIPSGQAFVCDGGGTWVQSTYSWTAAQFSWGAAVMGVWTQIPIVQGDWADAAEQWSAASYPWSQLWN